MLSFTGRKLWLLLVNSEVGFSFFLELPEFRVIGVDHQRQKRGVNVGKQAQTIPIEGSTQDQTKTGAMVHDASCERVNLCRKMILTIPAMQTLYQAQSIRNIQAISGFKIVWSLTNCLVAGYQLQPLSEFWAFAISKQ